MEKLKQKNEKKTNKNRTLILHKLTKWKIIYA